MHGKLKSWNCEDGLKNIKKKLFDSVFPISIPIGDQTLSVSFFRYSFPLKRSSYIVYILPIMMLVGCGSD